MTLTHQSQGAALSDLSAGGSITVSGLAAATAGDLVCILVQWGAGSGFGSNNPIPASIGWPNGSFVELDREATAYTGGSGVGGYSTIAYGVAAGGETSWAVATNEAAVYKGVSMVVDVFRGITSPTIHYAHQISAGSTATVPAVTPTSSQNAIIWTPFALAPNYSPGTLSGWTFGTQANGAYRQCVNSAYRIVTGTSGSYGGTLSSAGGETGWIVYNVAFDTGTPPVPVADFVGTPLAGNTPLSVAFTDLSTNVPTSWSWSFGDAGTSTAQSPTHNYAAAGTYTVALTATNASGSDTETKVAYVVVTDAVPGGSLGDPADAVPIGPDIISWRVQRGASPEITGGASVGTATVILKNSLAAGADEDNKYNPDNAGATLIAYLRDGIAIHIAVNNDGKLTGADPRGVFGGRTQDWTVLPVPGASVAPTVEVTCEDALGWYGRTPVNIGFAAGRSQGQMRDAILDAAEETRTDLAHEILTMPLSSGEGTALALLEDLNKANGTRHFVKPADASADWYTYVTRNRQWRLDGTVDATLDDGDHVTGTSGWRLSADTVTNQQKASVTPIRFTPSTYPVWQAESLPLRVTTTHPLETWVEFDDYVRSPVVNSAHSGATPTITLTPFGTTAKLTITVPSGTCTFTALAIEGSLARRLPAESWVADDLTSQVLPRGVRSGSEISGEYVGTLSCARGIAQHVVWRYATPQRRPTLTVVNWLPYQFEIDLYDVIAFTSPQLGVTSRHFEVVGLTHTAEMAAAAGVSHTVEYVLEECRVQDAADFPWFYLDDDPGSLLDDPDKMLAY